MVACRRRRLGGWNLEVTEVEPHRAPLATGSGARCCSRRDGLPALGCFPPPCPVPLGDGRKVGAHQLVVGAPLLRGGG